MKIRMVEGLVLIVTPESYVEQVALAKWAETHEGEGDLLIESYAQQNVQRTCDHEWVDVAGQVDEEETIILVCSKCGAIR